LERDKKYDLIKLKRGKKAKRYKARNQKQRAYYIKPFDEAKSLFLMIHST